MQARATLIRSSDGSTVICRAVVDLSGGNLPPACAGIAVPCRTVVDPSGGNLPPACLGIAVPVEGVDPGSVPGWVEAGVQPDWVRPDAVGWAPLVTVTGRWTGNAIQADGYAIFEPPGPTFDPVPCTSTIQGRDEADAEDPLDPEKAIGALNTYVAGHPERYSGVWRGQLSADDAVGVAVVGSVDDPAVVAPDVARIYPFRFCITRVKYSATELAGVVGDASRGHPWWEVETDPHGYVNVTVPFIDPASASALSTLGDRVVVEPLVRPASVPNG